MNPSQIEFAARQELENERFRKAVDEMKLKIAQRDNRTFWQKVFPWKITITRRG